MWLCLKENLDISYYFIGNVSIFCRYIFHNTHCSFLFSSYNSKSDKINSIENFLWYWSSGTLMHQKYLKVHKRPINRFLLQIHCTIYNTKTFRNIVNAFLLSNVLFKVLISSLSNITKHLHPKHFSKPNGAEINTFCCLFFRSTAHHVRWNVNYFQQ